MEHFRDMMTDNGMTENDIEEYELESVQERLWDSYRDAITPQGIQETMVNSFFTEGKMEFIDTDMIEAMDALSADKDTDVEQLFHLYTD